MPANGADNSELRGLEREGPTPVPSPSLSLRATILASLAAAVLALWLFSWLAEEVFEGDTLRFDDAVRAWIHQFASPSLTSVMVVISALGSQVLAVAVIIAGVIFLGLKWRRAAIWLLFTVAGGLVLEWTLKYAFHRARPAPFFGAVPLSYSFPSGHSLMSFCVYGVLAGLLSHRIRSASVRMMVWILAVALVAAIGVSRIYLGVHYPSDVIAGYLTAAVWVSALLAADRVRQHKRQHAAPKNVND
jgi:undecaprenyl-diphosphatase